MNMKYKAYEYYRFRKTLITLGIVLIADLLLCIGTRFWETGETFVFALLGVCFVLLLLFYWGRKFLIATLAVTDLDFKTLYEIDKRKGEKPENVSKNYALLGDCLFYDGYFSEAAEHYSIAEKS